MKDSLNRKINYLRLSVTDRCNFRCRYCVSGCEMGCENKKELLSFSRLFDICSAAVNCGIDKIRVTGGEPLVRDGVVDFLRKLRYIEKLKELTLTTNASLLSKYASSIKEVGVDRLNISIDTLDSEKFSYITRGGDLKDSLNGINAAFECGFKNTKLNVVLIKDFNIDEIEDFVNLTKDNDISVRFIELMPMKGCTADYNEKYISADIVQSKVKSLTPIGSDGVAKLFKIDSYKGTVGLIRPMTDKFCSTCNRIRITSDGRLKTCLHSSEEYDLSSYSSQELEEIISSLVLKKPEKHKMSLSNFSESLLSMNEIGG